MAQAEITQAEVQAVLPTVSATIADALGCDVEEVKPYLRWTAQPAG